MSLGKFYQNCCLIMMLIIYMIAGKGLFVTKSFVLQLRKKKITSVLIKETSYYCLHVLKLNQACININFIKHIFESYRKSVDYPSQNLDIGNKLTE